MSEGARPARRDVLKGLAAALGSAALAPACADDAVLPRTAADPEAVARAYFGADLDEVRPIGAAYLARFASARAIRRDLDETFAPLAAIRSPADVAAGLERAREADLQAARVVSLGGWQLAPTELRVAAVAELTRRGRSGAPAGRDDGEVAPPRP